MSTFIDKKAFEYLSRKAKYDVLEQCRGAYK
jgi:hypothetical protein